MRNNSQKNISGFAQFAQKKLRKTAQNSLRFMRKNCAKVRKKKICAKIAHILRKKYNHFVETLIRYLLVCLSVCLFVSNKRQTDWTYRAQILGGASHETRIFRNTKKFIWKHFENPRKKNCNPQKKYFLFFRKENAERIKIKVEIEHGCNAIYKLQIPIVQNLSNITFIKDNSWGLKLKSTFFWYYDSVWGSFSLLRSCIWNLIFVG